MSTWEALVERAATERGFAAGGEDEFSLETRRQAVGGPERLQRVFVRRFEAWGVPMLEVRSAFAPAAALGAEDALVQNLDLPIGAIARHGEVLVVVHKLPLEPISLDGVLFAVHRVSMVADVLEAKRGVDRF